MLTSKLQNSSTIQQDFLLYHLIFTFLSVLLLLMPISLASGIRVAFLTLSYHLTFPFWARYRKHNVLSQLWLFLLPLSIFQVFPDWFLSAHLKILVFPPDGFPKIGTVSAYMAGLWAIALMPILFLGTELQKKQTLLFTYGSVGLAALIVFGIAEETLWIIPIWYAQNVQMVSHTALYVLVPEMILGMTAFLAYDLTKDKTRFFQLIAAYVVMLIYTGALVFFWFFVG